MSRASKHLTFEIPNATSRIQDPVRVVFFDLGQTLVTASTQSPRRLLASKLVLSEKATRKVGRLIMTHHATEPSSLAEALAGFLTDHEQSRILAILEEVWEEQLHSVQAIDGAAAIMATLKDQGVKLGLLSNTWHPLYSGFLKNCPRMAELMDFSILSYQLGCKKPSPDIFRHALAGVGAPAEQCWMIGDSYELDMEPALMSGMHTMWVLHTPEKERPALAQLLRGERPIPDWTVARLDEILECFSWKGLL